MEQEITIESKSKMTISLWLLFFVFGWLSSLFGQLEEEEPIPEQTKTGIDAISLFLGGLPVKEHDSALLYAYEKSQTWQLKTK